MVRRAFCVSSLAAGVLISISSLQAKDPEYRIGDRAEADIVAPMSLVVVDAEATEAMKEKEAQRVMVIYRFYPRMADEVETALRSTFATTRSNFLSAVEAAFHQRKLDAPELSSTNFQAFVVSFQKQNILLPVGKDLAARWAGGEPDEAVESSLAVPLREAMRTFIRSDVAAQDIWVGSTLRLVSLADNETTSARLAEERGSNVSKTNFISLPRAKTELQNRFEDRAVGRYVASFVKPNCLMEADLTRELRARRTEGMAVTDRYESGQVIARRGQVIDRKIKYALDQIREKTAASQPPPIAAATPVKTVQEPGQPPWLIPALFGVVMALLAVVWRMARRPQSDSLLPAVIPGGPLEMSGQGADGSWRQRALQAEERVQRAQAAARAGLIAQLARWLSEKMTQKLMTQREQLLDAHQTAAIEIAELEARLAKVHAPLQERLRAYEQRIAELEKELLVKGEENRELIKAKIQIARKQLEIERGKTRMEFN